MIQFREEDHTYWDGDKQLPSVTQILDILSYQEFGNIDKSTLEYASRRGTAIHEATEALDLGFPADVDGETEPYLRAYMDFTRDYATPSWQGIEDLVYCDEYAGTCDRHGHIGDMEVVLDIKTVGSPNRLTYVKVCIQTYLYSLCLGYANPKLFALFLRKDGTYRLFDCLKWWHGNMSIDLWTASSKLVKTYYFIQSLKKGDK